MMLITYTLRIVDFLNPFNIIDRLATEITKDNLLESEEDPLQPIMDIIHGSIMKYDLETTRIGLKAVTDRVIGIIDSDDEIRSSEHFCNHLWRASRLAISREDEDTTVEVITNLENFGKSTAEKGLKDATAQATEYLGAAGIAAAGKGLEFATSETASSLGKVGKFAVKKGFDEVAQRAASILSESVVKVAAEKRLESATSQAVRSLAEVGIAAAKKRFESLTYQIVNYLREVGRTTAAKGFKDATWEAARSLKYVGIVAAEKELESATEQAAESLAELTFLSEEIVKTAIQDYESRLEEQERASFEGFMELYEQKLEKLRAERTQNRAM